jgi:hypothetical protein
VSPERVIRVFKAESVRRLYVAACTDCEFVSLPAIYQLNAESHGELHSRARKHTVEIREREEP